MTEPKQEVAFVSGASRGIGKAIATRLAKLGTYVVGTSTSEQGADEISRNLGTGGIGLKLDVSSKDSVTAMFNAIDTSDIPTPTIVINNAGITRDNLFVRMTDDQWDDVIETNLSSLYRLTKTFSRSMIKARYGRIVNVTSIVGITGNAGQANYAAAKAGIIGFTKSLAQELGPRGITVNAVAPGYVVTDMTKTISEDIRNDVLQRIPLKRLGSVEDIAAAVEFLVGTGSAYITGTTLHVNGGMYMG